MGSNLDANSAVRRGPGQILVAGMRGFTTYHMRAVVQFPDGTQYNDPDQVFTTGGLAPNQIPTMTATTTPGMTPSSGIELLDLLYAAPVGTAEYLVATDLSGNVIWYYDPGNIGVIPNPIKLLPNGNMLINYSNANVDGADSIMREVDLAGNVVWQMTAASSTPPWRPLDTISPFKERTTTSPFSPTVTWW